MKCSVDICNNPARTRGWCNRHYRLWRITGSTDDPIRLTLEDRFWSQVQKTDSCWLWIGWRNAFGYGRLYDGKKPVIAHRLSFFIHNGYWPSPMCLHACDNPPCVNPAHLKSGTGSENTQQMWDRRRRDRSTLKWPQRRGETAINAKLTEANVREIRDLWNKGATTYRQLSEMFHVSNSCIWGILTNRTWKYLTDELPAHSESEGGSAIRTNLSDNTL